MSTRLLLLAALTCACAREGNGFDRGNDSLLLQQGAAPGPGPVSITLPANRSRVVGTDTPFAVSYAGRSTPPASFSLSLDGQPFASGAVGTEPSTLDLSGVAPGAHTLCVVSSDGQRSDLAPTCSSFQQHLTIAVLAGVTGALLAAPPATLTALYAELIAAQQALSAADNVRAVQHLNGYLALLPVGAPAALQADAAWLIVHLGGAPAGAVPAAPVVTASSGIQQVSLSWPPAARASSYEIDRLEGTTWTLLGTWSGTRYTDDALVAGSYSYRVIARNAAGQSPASGTASGTAAPAHPRGAGYAAAVLADAPTGYWRLGDAPGSSTVADSSGNGHDGAVVGGSINFGAPGLASDFDTAAFFPASGYISVPNPASNAFGPSGAFSIEVWINPSGTAYMVEKYDAPGSLGYALRIEYGVLLLFVAGASASSIIWETPVVLNVTHHFVGTVDPTGLATLYADGVAVKSGQLSVPGAGSNPSVQIGARGDDRCCTLSGTLDEVAFYNGQALSAARVQAHYAAAQ